MGVTVSLRGEAREAVALATAHAKKVVQELNAPARASSALYSASRRLLQWSEAIGKKKLTR